LGFAPCFEDVLIKVSGFEGLAGDPRLTQYKAKAGTFVTAYSYHDQMSGTPTRDEQGTRDRPYDLIVDFDPEKIDGLLKLLGLKPWLGHRPTLAVFAGMQQGAASFVVTSDGSRDFAQRESLLVAAAKRGMPVVLPSTEALAKLNIGVASLANISPSTFASLVENTGGEVALIGRLVWVDRALGWRTRWQMAWQERPHRWQLRGISFDEAFRRGVGGAAQIFSGTGKPR